MNGQGKTRIFTPVLSLPTTHSLHEKYYKIQGPQITTYMNFASFPWDVENEGKLMGYRNSYVGKGYEKCMNCVKLQINLN